MPMNPKCGKNLIACQLAGMKYFGLYSIRIAEVQCYSVIGI